MSDTAPTPADDPEPAATPATPGRVRSLRLSAAVAVAGMAAVGLVLLALFDLGWAFAALWFVVAVPSVALGSVYLVDVARRSRAPG